jgi:hypothetical protein
MVRYVLPLWKSATAINERGDIKGRGLLPQKIPRLFLSPPWIQDLKLRRSLSLATQIPQDFGVWERIPRSTITTPKRPSSDGRVSAILTI